MAYALGATGRIVGTAAVALATIWIFGTAASAQAADARGQPMALRAIMDRLGSDMQEVAAAIAREDWPAVAALAPRIAHHDEPPATEKIRILTWLGTDALKFRGHDKQVGKSAVQMGETAAAGDGAAVIDAFAQVQHDCLTCHQAFRQRFVEHFHGDH